MPTTSFRLKVQQVEQTCLFELSWGEGQQLTAQLKYPPVLTALYQEWQQAYLGFYSEFRGRALQIIPVPKNVNWQSTLVEAETKLLNEFHHWLRSAELYEVRKTIAQVSRDYVSQNATEQQSIDVFLCCTPIDLARFPWEAWEIGTDLAATGVIRIVRSPANISAEPMPHRKRRHRARILAVLGDDTGLDFRSDRQAVSSLAKIAELKFVGWQPGYRAEAVKDQIRQALTDEEGWDVLFFAGHSNETAVTGGELVIAPNVSIKISEIEPQLTIAKQRGLQFAVFNSCSGLNIAESLIGLGFSQVAVMREPIHNEVAKEFIIKFAYGLSEFKDVQEALLAACQFLRLEKNLTYPSASLIPSLFCHPGASLFTIPLIVPLWKRLLRYVAPTRLEAIALAICLTILEFPSLQKIVLNHRIVDLSVQDFLLDRRLWTQSVYRNLTQQVPAAVPPPIVLVQIDEESVRRSGMTQPKPIDRRYLARILDRLTALNAKVVGFDYILDRQQPEQDAILGRSVRQSVSQNQSWVVFAADLLAGKEVGVNSQAGIVNRAWSLQGFVNSRPNYMMLRDPQKDCPAQRCPYAYLLSLVYTYVQSNPASVPALLSHLNNTGDLRSQLFNAIQQTAQPGSPPSLLLNTQFHPITLWADQYLDQQWLRPIIDFSIPPDRVYTSVSAWQILEQTENSKLANLSQQIVIIAPGGYAEAGDVFYLPIAMDYWRNQSATDETELPRKLTGTESLAYMIDHFLTNRLVIPVPDLWFVGIAVLLGRGAGLFIAQRQWSKRRQVQALVGLTGSTTLYGLFSLQCYISAAVLLPWTFPSIVLWIYVLSALRRSRV